MIKNEAPLLAGIETYEEQGIVKRFDSNNWLNKLNALIIEATLIQDTKQLYDLTSDLYQVYNDVLGIIDFQQVVDTNEMSELTNFIRKTNTDTKDYNKYINLIIDLKNTKNTVKLTDFLRAYADINPDKIFVILQTNTKTLNNNNRLISQVIKTFSENKIRINIQNLDLKEAPYMIGRAGAYTLEDQDWNIYKESFRKKTIGICVSETSIYIDVYRAFKDKVNYSEFRELILKSSKALLLATAIQRKRSDILFKPLNKINKDLQNKFFSLSNNYIRLWNYDLLFMNQNQEEKTDETGFTMFNHLLLSTVEELNEFCKSEETIFRSACFSRRYPAAWASSAVVVRNVKLPVSSYRPVRNKVA